MINRATILDKTHYGADIYSHIIREHFPSEIVMHVKGRDCGIIRNPFHDWEPCLNIIRLEPEKKLCDELAVHHDLSGTIPDGDVLDFAERYYGKSGQFLLEHINKEMNQHLKEDFQYYQKPGEKPKGPRFSFFRAPITNTRPYKSITLTGAFAYITGHYAAEQTRTLHSITDKNQTRLYKAAHFDYATFCSQFRTRSDKDVLEVSNLICLDFDHLVDVECLFQKLLLRDGTAVPKPIRPRPQMGHPHRRESPVPRRLLRRAAYYIKQTYSIEVDKSDKDLSRACFLPHDSNAYLNPKYATR